MHKKTHTQHIYQMSEFPMKLNVFIRTFIRVQFEIIEKSIGLVQWKQNKKSYTIKYIE